MYKSAMQRCGQWVRTATGLLLLILSALLVTILAPILFITDRILGGPRPDQKLRAR